MRSSARTSQGQLTGNTGDILFETKGGDKSAMIRELIVSGNVVIIRAGKGQAPFDRAESSYARYSAERGENISPYPDYVLAEQRAHGGGSEIRVL